MPDLFRIFKPSRGQLVLAALLAITFYMFLLVQRNWTVSAPTAQQAPPETPRPSTAPAPAVSIESVEPRSAQSRPTTFGEKVVPTPRTENGSDNAPSRHAPLTTGEHSDTADDVFDSPVPATTGELQAMEDVIVEQVPQALASTVAIRAYYIQGSGVIVTADGFVLTAAHVAVKVGQRLDIILADKREVPGETVYVDHSLDVAIVQLDDPGPWPASPMAEKLELTPGLWCLATGHSGGYSEARPAVVRLGRLINVDADYLESDCPLVGGDSGGPLFDMQGRVIGIHSRIGPTVARNFHAPVAVYQRRWEEIVNADKTKPSQTADDSPHADPEPVRGGPVPPQAMLGLFAEDIVRGCRVTEVLADKPADKGGIRLDDVILKVDGVSILSFNHLRELIREREPGQKVVLTIQRDNRELEEEVVLGALETSS